MRSRHYGREGNPAAVIVSIVAMAVWAPIASGRVAFGDALGNALVGFGVGMAVLAAALFIVPHLRIPKSVNAAKARRALEWGEAYGAKAGGDTHATMTRRGYPGRVEFLGGLRPSTSVSFAIEGAVDGAVTVTRESLGQQFIRSAGIGDYEIGDRLFDQVYCVKGTDEKTARAVLGTTARDALMALEKYFDATLMVTPRMMVLSARGLQYERAEFEALMTAAVRIFDSLKLPERESVLVVETRQILADAKCGVCCTGLAGGEIVRCAKCTTPHHKDCWDFNGRCAVFSCGSDRTHHAANR